MGTLTIHDTTVPPHQPDNEPGWYERAVGSRFAPYVLSISTCGATSEYGIYDNARKEALTDLTGYQPWRCTRVRGAVAMAAQLNRRYPDGPAAP